MAVLKKVREMLQSILEQFNSLSTDKGLLEYDGEELVTGITVHIVDEEGNSQPAEDGDYFLGEEDGRTIVVENGIIKDIIEPEPQPAEPVEENLEGEEGSEGDNNENNESGNEGETPQEPGNEEGNEENGEGDGDGEDEDGEEEENVVDKKKKKKEDIFNKIKAVFEESYEEKESKIISAIRSKGFDCWLVEAGDDYAVVEVWNDAELNYVHYKFPVSWNGEEAVVGDPEEVKSEYVPVNSEPVVEEEVFSKQEKEGLEQQIVQLKAKIAELEGQPAEKPAKERFKNQVIKSDNDKLDNFINRYVK